MADNSKYVYVCDFCKKVKPKVELATIVASPKLANADPRLARRGLDACVECVDKVFGKVAA